MSVRESTLIFFACVWFALGFLSVLCMCIRSGEVTVEDAIMSVVGGCLGPIALIAALLVIGKSITIWKKK